jgi:hypothetical protein
MAWSSRRRKIPPSSFLLEERIEFRPGFFPASYPASRSRKFLKGKKLAEVIFLPVTHPFGRGLPTFILGVFIIKSAIQAAVQVTAAMGTDFLAPHYPSFPDFLPASITSKHVSLYTQLPGKVKRKGPRVETDPSLLMRKPSSLVLFIQVARSFPAVHLPG